MQKEKGIEKGIGVMLPIVFMIIMFSDSYLLGHFTTMLFVLFSALVYKPVDEINA